MARKRKKKKNLFKPLFNLIVFVFLLFIIVFLVQRFIIPMWQERPIIKKAPEEIEEEEPISEIRKTEIALYFSDENAQYLISESRTIDVGDYPERQAIVELIKGPKNQNLYPTIPQTTTVNALYINEGIAYIDFSSNLIKDHPGGSTGELLTVYSVVTTLTSFPNIDKVQLLIDGNSGETLVGHVDTSIPLERDEQWIR